MNMSPRTLRALSTSLIALHLAAACLHANPRGGVVVRGSAAIDGSNPSVTTIRQYTDKAIINWQGFGNRAGEAIRFEQPGPKAAILNRVTGSETSVIDGAMSSNGRVWVLNPNGVLIGRNATVNVGGLVASTLAISDDDFAAGRHTLRQGPGPMRAVVNKGRITAAPGGPVALVAPVVANEGEIHAPGGKVALAAGTEATLDLDGGGLMKVAVRTGAPGTVEVTREQASQLMEDVVNTGTVVNAGSVSVKNGVLELSGSEGLAINSGRIDAGAGGVDIVSSQATVLAAGSRITANASGAGRGGEVRALSHGTTVFAREARIEAEGGEVGGDGGFVEVSGKHVHADGLVSTRAPRGAAGTYLIDPVNLTIDNTSTGVDSLGVDTINAGLAMNGTFIVQADSSIRFQNTSNIVGPALSSLFLTVNTQAIPLASAQGISVFVNGTPGSITANQITVQTRNLTQGVQLHNTHPAGGVVALNADATVVMSMLASSATATVGTPANPIVVNAPRVEVSNTTGGGAYLRSVRTGDTAFAANVGGDYVLEATAGSLTLGLVSGIGFTGVRAGGDIEIETLAAGQGIALPRTGTSTVQSTGIGREVRILSGGDATGPAPLLGDRVTVRAGGTITNLPITSRSADLGAAAGIGPFVPVSVQADTVRVTSQSGGVQLDLASFTAGSVTVDTGGATVGGNLVISTPTAGLTVGPAGLAGTGIVTLQTRETGGDITINGAVTSPQGVNISSRSRVIGAGAVTAPTVSLTAVSGIGTRIDPVVVDAPFLTLMNTGSLGAFVTDRNAGPVQVVSGGGTGAGDVFVTATVGSLVVPAGRNVLASGALRLEALAPGADILLAGSVQGDSVVLSAADVIASSGGGATANTVLLSATNGIGTAAAPVRVDAANLALRNPGGGGAFVADTGLALINLDTQASTIGGILQVTATRAALTVNSFGVAATGDIRLATQGAGSDIFAIGAIAADRAVALTSTARIGGPGRINGTAVALTGPLGIGSAATPLNVNSQNIELQNATAGGVFLNAGSAVTIGGSVAGDFQLTALGDVTLRTVSATGAFVIATDGSVLNGADAGADNLVGGAGSSSIAAGAIIGTRANPLRINIPAGTLFLDPANAAGDGVSAALTGVLAPEGNFRLATPPGTIVFNGVPVFVPPVNLFAEGQLNFSGTTLFPSEFDLSQAALAMASYKEGWKMDAGDKSMGVAGTSGRMLMEDDLAREVEGTESAAAVQGE